MSITKLLRTWGLHQADVIAQGGDSILSRDDDGDVDGDSRFQAQDDSSRQKVGVLPAAGQSSGLAQSNRPLARSRRAVYAAQRGAVVQLDEGPPPAVC